MAATNPNWIWQENPESGVGQYLDPSHGMASAYDPALTPRSKINPETEAALRKLGYTGDLFSDNPEVQGNAETGTGTGASSQLNPAFQQWMQQQGITPSAYAQGDGSNIDFNGPQGLIGSTHNQAMQSPEFMAAAALGGGMFLGPGIAAGMGGGGAGVAGPTAGEIAGADSALTGTITGAGTGGGAAGGAVAGGAAAGVAPGATSGGLGGLLGSSGGVLGSGVSLGQAGSLIGAAGGLLANGSGLNSATQTSQNTIDPRLAKYLYGADGNGGLLGGVNQLYQQQMQTGGLNPLQQQGIASQQAVLQDPSYMQGFNQMRQAGGGLLGQPIAGNPFTSGQASLGSQPGSLMDAGRSYIPQRPGLLGSK